MPSKTIRADVSMHHARTPLIGALGPTNHREHDMFVRISRGRYKPKLHAEVTTRLDRSAATLIPPIRALPGCLSFYAGSDDASNTMINVSVWDSLEHAQAMDSQPEMAALTKEFTALGVEFERPNTNYAVLWSLPEL